MPMRRALLVMLTVSWPAATAGRAGAMIPNAEAPDPAAAERAPPGRPRRPAHSPDPAPGPPRLKPADPGSMGRLRRLDGPVVVPGAPDFRFDVE